MFGLLSVSSPVFSSQVPALARALGRECVDVSVVLVVDKVKATVSLLELQE